MVDDTNNLDTMYTMKGMKGGLLYTVKIQAKNKNGWSDFNSPFVSIRTASGVPGAPPKPLYYNVSYTTLSLSWDAPPDNGAPITGYVIRMQTSGTGGFFTKIKNTGSSANNIFITGLRTGGTGYEFKVAAINKNGVGPASVNSDVAQTLYSSASATQDAAAQALESFKINNELNTLKELSAGYKLYKGEYKQALAQIRILKEQLVASENTANQIRQAGQVETDLLSTRQQIERGATQQRLVMGEKLNAMRYATTAKSFELKAQNTERLMNERVIAQRKIFEDGMQKKDEQIDRLKDQIWKLNQVIVKEKHLRKMTQARARGPAVLGVDVRKRKERELRESRADDRHTDKAQAKPSKKALQKAAKKVMDKALQKMFDRATKTRVKDAAFQHQLQEQKKVNAVESFLMHQPAAPVASEHVAELGAQDY